MFTSFGGVIGATLLVVGLVVLALAAVRRLAGVRGAPGAPGLRIVRRLALGPRQGIVLVEIGDRLLALSVGEGGVRALAELDPLDDAPTVEATQRTETPLHPIAQIVRRAFGAAVLGMALLGAAQPAAAQAAGAAAPSASVGVRDSAAAPAMARPADSSATTRRRIRAAARADTALGRLAPRIDLSVASGGAGGAGGLRLSGTVGVVVMLGLLSLLPMLVLLMTGFTRVLIVLQLLRQAIGAQNVPPPQVVTAMALLITGFVMAPTLNEVNRTALTPWLDGRIEQAQMLSLGAQPFRAFMLRETRPSDVQLYLNLADHPPVATPNDIPLSVLMTAFVTSEVRIAFQMGFALFLPFIVIDIVVASVLMSMGMMMLPPTMVSLPFKLLLFVLVDGWNLVVQGLIRSFH
ncbi:MAG: flagellar type III secretion system pore protein FliP [Gemmatimonadetes bacterium]|nr:flagellar type III secretion system pore protein FliP [Gemmatimonadota bacterium]